MVKSKQLFILLGNDQTGKTTLQKWLIHKMCGHWYERLPTNLRFSISHLEIKRKYQDMSLGNRSYQEKIGDYKTVENYFNKFFKEADIAVISSHLVSSDIEEMILQGKSRFYNVTGIFWTNSIEASEQINREISLLNWDERLLIENPSVEREDVIDEQLERIAEYIVSFIVSRTGIS